MQSAEEADDRAGPDQASRNPISAAILAALAFVPLLVAVGFLTDHTAGVTVPPDISVLALRGVFDGGATARPQGPSRAGY